jgi:hypothetical protein
MTTAIGRVSLTDFDRGVIESLGSQLIDIQVEDGTRKAYAIRVDGLDTNVQAYAPYVPVFFSTPEDVFQPFKYPCVVVRRNDLTPAFDRSPFYGYQRVPAPNAQLIKTAAGNKVLEGYSSYVSAVLPTPFNISYDVQVYARTQNVGIVLLTRILQTTRPPFFSVAVYDDLNDRRLYDAGEVSISSASELADIADRTIAWTISFEVRGEIDLQAQMLENSIVTTMQNIQVQVVNLDIRLMTRLGLITRLHNQFSLLKA